MLVWTGFSHQIMLENIPAYTSTQAGSHQTIIMGIHACNDGQNLLSNAKGPGCLGFFGGLYYPVLWGLYCTVMSSMTGPLSFEQVHTRISRTKPSWWTDGPAFGILLCSSVIETNGWCRWPLRSENKKPGCLGYMADSTTQFYRALYETLL